MSKDIANSIAIPIEVLGLPSSELCYENTEQFLKLLSKYLVGRAPVSISNVIISNIQPNSSQTGSIWVKQNSAGTVIGIAFYSGAQWIQVLPAPGEIIWMGGVGVSSDAVPPGFKLIDNDNAKFTTSQVTSIMTNYYPGTAPYSIFAVTYEGV